MELTFYIARGGVRGVRDLIVYRKLDFIGSIGSVFKKEGKNTIQTRKPSNIISTSIGSMELILLFWNPYYCRC